MAGENIPETPGESARFTGQVAVVTGAAHGIGRAVAGRLAAEGAAVLVVDRDVEAANQAAVELAASGARARACGGDVGEESTAAEAVKAAVAAWGRVDVLVNSAGIIGATGPITDVAVTELDRVYRVNLRGTFLFCRAVVPHMQARAYGRIVNVASIAGKEGNPSMIPYSATKAAVIALTKSLAKEVAAQGILVNCVTPAVIRTRIWEQTTAAQMETLLAKIPLGRAGSPEEVAALVAWLASAECSFSTGAAFDISGGRATY